MFVVVVYHYLTLYSILIMLFSCYEPFHSNIMSGNVSLEFMRMIMLVVVVVVVYYYPTLYSILIMLLVAMSRSILI